MREASKIKAASSELRKKAQHNLHRLQGLQRKAGTASTASTKKVSKMARAKVESERKFKSFAVKEYRASKKYGAKFKREKARKRERERMLAKYLPISCKYMENGNYRHCNKPSRGYDMKTGVHKGKCLEWRSGGKCHIQQAHGANGLNDTTQIKRYSSKYVPKGSQKEFKTRRCVSSGKKQCDRCAAPINGDIFGKYDGWVFHSCEEVVVYQFLHTANPLWRGKVVIPRTGANKKGYEEKLKQGMVKRMTATLRKSQACRFVHKNSKRAYCVVKKMCKCAQISGTSKELGDSYFRRSPFRRHRHRTMIRRPVPRVIRRPVPRVIRRPIRRFVPRRSNVNVKWGVVKSGSCSKVSVEMAHALYIECARS